MSIDTGPAGRDVAPIEEEGRFDPAEYRDELAAAPANHEIGTALLFENDAVRIFEIRLSPGQRGAFHVHDRDYFWTVVADGRGKQRLADGTWAIRRYRSGDTKFLHHTPEQALVHDLENIGDSELRFVTVELKGHAGAQAG